jgi:hypothetical protein
MALKRIAQLSAVTVAAALALGVAPAAQATAAPAGAEAAAQAASSMPFRDGQRLIDDSDGAVYLILDGKRRHIRSWWLHDQLFKNHKHLIKVPSTAGMPLGSYLPNDTKIIAGADRPEIYLYVDGVKRHIPSWDMFNWYHLDRNKIDYKHPADLDKIADGAALDNEIG